MGNGGINIRFLWWHLQISKSWRPKITFNKHHWDNKLEDGWFKIYEWDMKKDKPTKQSPIIPTTTLKTKHDVCLCDGDDRDMGSTVDDNGIMYCMHCGYDR